MVPCISGLQPIKKICIVSMSLCGSDIHKQVLNYNQGFASAQPLY